jgi:RHS repeat-associated protein
MSESGGMNVNRLTAGGQTVATDVKGNITTLPVNLRPAGATTAINLTWDSDNKLRSADIDANGTADLTFQYDALGRRVARSGTGGSVVYVQMDQQTIADYPVGGAATTPTFRYVFASYIDEPVVRKTAGTGGTLVYFHRNHQYSITAVTTSAGAIAERYAYTAYGQPTILDASASVLSSSAINNRYTYTGREWDATLGLHHFRARWMSPIAGKFITRDPIVYLDGLNVYKVQLDLKHLDPSGKTTLRECEDAVSIFRSTIENPCKQMGISIKCEVASSDDDRGGYTGCEENDSWIVIVVFYNNLTVDGLTRILNHEFQHVTDICSCSKKCDTVRHTKGKFDQAYCDRLACLEIRACTISDCAGKQGVELEECVKDCAKYSIRKSKHCESRWESLLKSGMKKCFSKTRPLPPFPL